MNKPQRVTYTFSDLSLHGRLAKVLGQHVVLEFLCQLHLLE